MLSSSTAQFQSRAVSLSSSGHRASNIHPENYNLEGIYSPFLAYVQSKTANIFFANGIERRCGSQGLHAWSLHPGLIFETSIVRHQDASASEGDQKSLYDRIYEQEPRITRLAKNVGQGAATQVWAAVAAELEGAGGRYLDDCQVAEESKDMGAGTVFRGHAPWIYDVAMAERLWRDSRRMVGLPDEE